jgi:O-antigen ligase
MVVLAGAIVLVVLRPPDASTSYRSDYWRVALAEAAEHPLLGSGAGSFYMTWREHRDVELSVRDAHSLYVETLSELGPLGLVLVLVLVGTPLAAAVRRRGEAITASAGAGFVVFAAHAGVDWDWEMPVVTLAGLALAAVLIADGAAPTESGDPRTGRQR